MNFKQMVGIEATKYIQNDMIVGLGTGSTAYYMVEEVGRKIKEEGLKITGVTTSKATEAQASALGIPLRSIDEVSHVDLTIDGADEIDKNFQGIKGGGAALLFEKIVATYSKEVIWIVDQSKMVNTLGAFPLPVEVIPYGSQQIFRILEKRGYQPQFRLKTDGSFLYTDSQNLIIDLAMETIANPEQLAEELTNMVGVVEHGLFLNMVHRVIIGSDSGLVTLENPKFL
ncbi:ribose-5-phosphate isomerase RpiA [Enterococcus asini]|uniref:ribose-5-phosphate isomerase RpiA n=1 Tax=Enterococcus asini TaxID=57732 RepID=UPI00288F464B|nr:ribose-5-phosphate isomerase RpiA [Enterococcus asini]MDT2757091.1 ribose-5-phosphate isomerase RpiA [Enterococcus asini]